MSNSRSKAQDLLRTIEAHLTNNNLSNRKAEILYLLKEYLRNTDLIQPGVIRKTINPARLTTIEDILKYVNDYDLTFFKQTALITGKITNSNCELKNVVGLTAGFNAHELILGNTMYMALLLGIFTSYYFKSWIPLITAFVAVSIGEMRHNQEVQNCIQKRLSTLESFERFEQTVRYKNMIENTPMKEALEIRMLSYLKTAGCATEALLSYCGLFKRFPNNQASTQQPAHPERTIQARRS